MLARNAQRLPDWLGLVVTSRPEFDVRTPLQALNPFLLDTQSESNRADLRDYLQQNLASQFQNRPDGDRLVEQILEKSEGVFLYVERFCEDVRLGHLSLDHPDQFPQGLGGTFDQYFKRQFPDLEKFRKDVRPALRAILAAREPLPMEILQRLFNWQDEKLRDFTRPLASFFPVSGKAGHEVIKPYHKSLADWLADEAKAGVYFVSVLEGHRILGELGFREYNHDVQQMSQYTLKYTPWHLFDSGQIEQVRNILADRKYIDVDSNFDVLLAQRPSKWVWLVWPDEVLRLGPVALAMHKALINGVYTPPGRWFSITDVFSRGSIDWQCNKCGFMRWQTPNNDPPGSCCPSCGWNGG
jgi:hypothetical protein